MVFGALKAQASSGVLRTNWSSWASFPSSGRLFWPLYARSWHVAWIGGSRVAVHARAGIDFVRLRLPPCSSAPTSARCPVPCVRTVPCVRGSARGGPGRRLASAVYAGYTIPPSYDSVIAKLLACAPTRAEAIAKMRWALAEFIVDGVDTNIDFQLSIIADPGFIAADYDNGYLARRLAEG